MQPMIDAHFGGGSLGEIVASLRAEDSQFAENTLELLGRNSPLSMACTVEMLHRMAGTRDVSVRRSNWNTASSTARLEHSDLVEGIRAAVIDKDRNPNWEYDMENLPQRGSRTYARPAWATTN